MKKVITKMLNFTLLLIVAVSCNFDKELNFDVVNTSLDLNVAQSLYEKLSSNARLGFEKTNIPRWDKAVTTTFANGVPVITIPTAVIGLPQFTTVQRNGKAEKVPNPAPMLISYKDRKTNQYLFKVIQILPEKGTTLKNGLYSFQSLKGYVLVSEMSGKLVTVFDVNKGKYDTYSSAPIARKNGRVAGCNLVTVCFFTSGCFNSGDFVIMGTSSSSDYGFCSTPSSPPSYPGMNCENWRQTGSDITLMCTPDIEYPDPAVANPINDLGNNGGGYELGYSYQTSVFPNLCEGYKEMLVAQKKEWKEMIGLITTDNKVIILPSLKSTYTRANLTIGPTNDAIGRPQISTIQNADGTFNVMLYHYIDINNIFASTSQSVYNIKATIHTHPIDYRKEGWDEPSGIDKDFAKKYTALEHYILHDEALIKYNQLGEISRQNTTNWKGNLNCQ